MSLVKGLQFYGVARVALPRLRATTGAGFVQLNVRRIVLERSIGWKLLNATI